MDRRERLDALSPLSPPEQATDAHGQQLSPAEQLLTAFTDAEQQRLRYLRQLYERGKLTEFPQRPRD